jgi:hypothetical protein
MNDAKLWNEALMFDGDRGAHYEKKLIGGVDIRDYNRGVYTNTVDGVSSRAAFDNGNGQRMDLIQGFSARHLLGGVRAVGAVAGKVVRWHAT